MQGKGNAYVEGEVEVERDKVMHHQRIKNVSNTGSST